MISHHLQILLLGMKLLCNAIRPGSYIIIPCLVLALVNGLRLTPFNSPLSCLHRMRVGRITMLHMLQYDGGERLIRVRELTDAPMLVQRMLMVSDCFLWWQWHRSRTTLPQLPIKLRSALRLPFDLQRSVKLPTPGHMAMDHLT